MFSYRVLVPIVLACATATAQAQIVLSNYVQPIPGPGQVWYIDVATGERTILCPGVAVAIGVDDTGGRVFMMNDSLPRLYQWNYGPPVAPTLLGNVHLASGANVSTVGLAYGGGKLIGAVEGSPYGLYEINPATLVATPMLTGADIYLPDALAFNATNGLFYGLVDWSNSRGLYSYDLLGSLAVNLVAPMPPGNPDIDGLAIGNNRAYLIGDDQQFFQVFDFATASYLTTTVPSPWVQNGFFSGADWAPSAPVQRRPHIYCEGKTNSLGCIPYLVWNGDASATNATPFKLQVAHVRSATSILLAYSTSGAATTPFHGGTLCMAAPVHRTALASTTGVFPDCAGTTTFDFNGYIASGADPALVVGQTVWLQFISRDKGFAPPNNYGLSPAVRALIKP